MKYVPRILPYLRPYWALATASWIIVLLHALSSLLTPWPLKLLVDNVLGRQPLPPVLAHALGGLAQDRVALLIVVVAAGFFATLLEGGLNVVSNYVSTKLDQHMVLDFRCDLFQHAQRLSLAFHDQRRSGNLIYAINYQAEAVPGVIMAAQPTVQSVITLVGMFWILLQIDVQLALLSLTVVPFLYYAIGYYATHIQDRIRYVKGMEGESLSIIHEAMSMLRVIVAFGREDHEYYRFRSQGERTVDARVKLTVRQTLFSLAVSATTAAGTALVLGFGAYHAMQGALTVGQLLVAMSYLASVYSPLEAISSTISSLQDHFVSLEMAFKVRDVEPEVTDAAGARPAGLVRGAIRFENVCFDYKGRQNTLSDISFDVPAGQVIGIVGPTGAGKSTLVSLIPRFYDPRQGRILLDGVDIRALTVKSLREQISIVLQEPLLFSGTIADNIRYGRLQASMDEIVEAARAANAHDFISRLPRGYDTELGERGAQLSGGERQRISVARAFLKDAPILILDEPTSSIDSKTEEVILEALERLMQGRTTLMIAHRLSTLRKSDTILVVNQGELVELGTHEALLQRGGMYRQLFDMQDGHTRNSSEPAPRGAVAVTAEHGS